MSRAAVIWFVLSFLPGRHVAAQTSDTMRIARAVPDSLALAPLIYLASDQLKGRFIGTPEIDTAAKYIITQFRNAGARPVPGARTYFQAFTRTITREDLMNAGQDIGKNFPAHTSSKDFVIRNIVAYIPGTDSILRRQYIVLSAHYDHIGQANYPQNIRGKSDSIYNGARDNATGTAAVIAAARYFGKYPPLRSVLLVCWSGEEEGEFGSEYYANHPLIPLRKTVFNLNNDNAGYNRTDAICLFGLGRTSADYHVLEACSAYDLTVLPEPPGLGLFQRSDNFSLAKYGIPAPCFSMGIQPWNADIDLYYHRRGDEVDNMDLHYVLKFIRAYILSAQYIADDPVQPVWTANDEFSKAWSKLYGSPSHSSASPQHAVLPPLARP